MHICNHYGTPTIGAFYCKDLGKTIRLQMCQECRDYIGSPAAQQEGATMMNRKTAAEKVNQAACEILLEAVCDCAKKVV